jgi:hypothetical protein
MFEPFRHGSVFTRRYLIDPRHELGQGFVDDSVQDHPGGQCHTGDDHDHGQNAAQQEMVVAAFINPCGQAYFDAADQVAPVVDSACFADQMGWVRGKISNR